jgi:hypothetical protein
MESTIHFNSFWKKCSKSFQFDSFAINPFLNDLIIPDWNYLAINWIAHYAFITLFKQCFVCFIPVILVEGCPLCIISGTSRCLSRTADLLIKIWKFVTFCNFLCKTEVE